MALRIDDVLVGGEIDNTTEGRVRGWLWLLGQPEPISLDLLGDCWRDLAGCRLRFRNPQPQPVRGASLEGVQKGVVGDMTASKRVRVPVGRTDEVAARLAAGEEVPTKWRNAIYLEWFSESHGRVVIESTGYEMELSAQAWEMDPDAEEAQKLANLQAMRDFLEGVIARRDPPPEGAEPKDDEFEWEERLKESDRLTDAYQEVMEKYLDDPDAEQKEAFVMGWDGLLDAMASESEGKEPEMPEWKQEALEAANEVIDTDAWKEEEDWEDDLFEAHPLQEQAQELAMRSVDLVHEEGQSMEDAAELTSSLTQVAGKLAGALNGSYEREAGYVLAILKRCLNWQNDALAACGRLVESESDHDRARALEALRDEIFVQRQAMTDLRQKLKKS